ncbi:MAG: AAA family ATPase [Bacteroidetes bacterium]|nr:AAA family ATPase [Bacteroidota bacterium]
MSILIDRVRISGFRGLKDIEINLSRITLLLGVNNSGKTSIIRALQLALGNYSRYLSNDDFHIDSNDIRCEKIIVDLRIIPLNIQGMRKENFMEDWVDEFGNYLRSEAIDGKPEKYQFLAMRTVAYPDPIKGGFSVDHFVLDQWVPFSLWQSVESKNDNRINRRFESIPFISVDAQRDIHQELRDRTSFIGKILSAVQYENTDVSELETLIASINEKAVAKSEPLRILKNQLDTMNQSADGDGIAEITPIPKKMRDLAKRFSIHFGDSDKNLFSMEYHGMGTRSWASMLAFKAFVELKAEIYQREHKAFNPIIALEEPESHLHPNAQRTLYQQLKNNPNSQVVVSTHSPYLPAISSLSEIRMLKKTHTGVQANSLIDDLNEWEVTKLRTKIIRHKGDIFFSKILILVEGETEENLIPGMFKLYSGSHLFEKGIDCIGVGGKEYRPFLIFALSYDIPVCIISDNDKNTKSEVELQISKIQNEYDFDMTEKNFSLEFLGEGKNLENELLSIPNLREDLINALVYLKAGQDLRYTNARRQELSNMNDEDLLDELKRHKPGYAYFLSDLVSKCSESRGMIPNAFLKTFRRIDDWV